MLLRLRRKTFLPRVSRFSTSLSHGVELLGLLLISELLQWPAANWELGVCGKKKVLCTVTDIHSLHYTTLITLLTLGIWLFFWNLPCAMALTFGLSTVVVRIDSEVSQRDPKWWFAALKGTFCRHKAQLALDPGRLLSRSLADSARWQHIMHCTLIWNWKFQVWRGAATKLALLTDVDTWCV